MFFLFICRYKMAHYWTKSEDAELLAMAVEKINQKVSGSLRGSKFWTHVKIGEHKTCASLKNRFIRLMADLEENVSISNDDKKLLYVAVGMRKGKQLIRLSGFGENELLTDS
jgi:hypothetical protein